MTRSWTADDTGFTLVELIIVMVIVGILVALPVASYLHFTDRADSAVARSNVREIAPSTEAYYADHTTYVGMTVNGLRQAYDQALDPAHYTLTSLTATGYCVSSSVGSASWKKQGPDVDYEEGSC